MLQRGQSADGCDLTSNLCKYDLRKVDIFVLSWARVQRVRRGSMSELLMCGGGVSSILLLPLVARCLETIYVCIYSCHSAIGKRVGINFERAVGSWILTACKKVESENLNVTIRATN